MGRYQTSVASVVYNMAGDIDLRPNVVKGTVLSEVLGSKSPDIAGALHKAFTSGPGVDQRNFFRWARTNLDDGIPTGSLGSAIKVDNTKVTSGMHTELLFAAAQSLCVDEAYLDDAEPDYWADMWVRESHPTLSPDDWVASFDATTSEFVIDFAQDGLNEARIPAPADFLWSLQTPGVRNLLYVIFTTVTDYGDHLEESARRLHVYRIGSGNVVLDSLTNNTNTTMGEFFPALPVRLKNKAIDHTTYEDDFPNISKAYKKLTGRKIGDLLTSLEENEDIGDIDHAFVLPGVTLNTKDEAAKEYLYRFMTKLQDVQQSTKGDFTGFFNRQAQRGAEQVAWDRWLKGSKTTAHPAYGFSKPVRPGIAGSAPLSEIRIHSPVRKQFDVRIQWAYINETLEVGNCNTFDGVTRPPAKTGEVVLHKTDPWVDEADVPSILGRVFNQRYDRFFLCKQIGPLAYKKLEVCGLYHKNYVYGSHAVKTRSNEALDDDEESGFLIPLHYPTLREMGLPKATQLATANTYLLMNCYYRRKRRWYERGFFKILVVIVAIAISVVTAGGSLAAAGGVLGTNAAVGAAVLGAGASVATAAVVGAITNYVAAMVVTSIAMRASTELFGEKWGAIIGTVATFVAIQYGTAYADTGSFTVDWGKIMSADNFMNLTKTTGDAYQLWLQADTREIQQTMLNLSEDHAERLEELNDLADTVLGVTATGFNPTVLTGTPENLGESMDSFINRTLLTGNDIVDVTHLMIENFAEISLKLPDMPR